MQIEALYAGLVAVCVFFAVLFSVACAAIVVWPFVRDFINRWRKLGAGDKAVAIIALVIAIAYGGVKPVRNAGADENIALVSVAVGYDGTNTAVEVKFTGQCATTTPVSVRNAETEQWRELVKIGATVTSDLATNVLAFTVSGDESTNRYWWVGTETPAVIVESTGIEITHFAVSSQSVQISWTCNDQNATEFAVQRRRKGAGAGRWETVVETTDNAFEFIGFTVGETWEWRVTSTYTEGDDL